jgi:hypothetical protein
LRSQLSLRRRRVAYIGDALFEFALELVTRPEQEFVYADDRRRDPRRGKTAAFFKPEWSPDLLWSTSYIGRSWCASATLAEQPLLFARCSRGLGCLRGLLPADVFRACEQTLGASLRFPLN